MTTPPPPHEPDEPADDVTPAPPSLFDRLAEFEPEDDDLFDDEYDDEPAADPATDPAADPATEPSGDDAPAFHPVDPAAEPGADDEPAVTAYDDSAFAAADPPDEPTEHEPTPEPADVAWADLPVPDEAETVVLEHELPDATDTAALDELAAAPAPLAAVPVDVPPAAAGTPPAEPVDEAPTPEEPAEPTAPLVAENGRRRRSGRRLTLPVVALLLMTALMAAATAYLWLQVRDHSRTESARRSGLEASRDAARLLFSYDYRTLDKDFQTGLALTTGDFRNQYNKTTTKVVADVAKQYKAVVKANVVGAGIVSATPNKVVTVVYVNQVTTSTRVTGEKVDLSRVRMTLERSNGRWLVTSVNAL